MRGRFARASGSGSGSSRSGSGDARGFDGIMEGRASDDRGAFVGLGAGTAATLVQLVFPLLWLGLLYSAVRRQLGGATGNVGKKASSLRLSADDLSFDDVAGIDLAKDEVREVVSMLKEPKRYAALGARQAGARADVLILVSGGTSGRGPVGVALGRPTTLVRAARVATTRRPPVVKRRTARK